MKQTIIAIFIIMFSGQSFADGDWLEMRKTGSQSIDLKYSECSYKQALFGKFAISITIKGSTLSCPHSIEYNPVTGKWRR